MDEFSVALLVALFKRHFKIGAALFAAFALICMGAAMSYSTYRASATVEVGASEIPADVTLPAGANPNNMSEMLADLRISRLHQKVTSTASLIDIIVKFNLYPKERAETPLASIADAMRKKIKMSLVGTSLANPASAQKAAVGQLSAIAFELSFDYDSPLLAQQVTNEIVSRFLDEDLKQRRQQTEETTAFLDTQIKQLEESLAEQEKKIAAYKLESGDTRPEALMFNQQAAAQTGLSLQSVETQIASANGTIGALRAQLAALDPYSRAFADGAVLASPALQRKALETKLATLAAQYGPDHPDVVKTRKQIQALKGSGRPSVDGGELNAKIEEIETKLATARQTYGEENPDVLSLKRQFEKLRATRAANIATNNDGIPQDADNPSYLSVVAQLRSAQGQLKGLEEQRESLAAQQEKYKQAVIGNPIAEQNLAALTRDYDNAQLRYRELKARKMAADMEEKLERERKGQKMNVINPPELPLHTKPPRLLLLIAGFVFSLGAAAGGVLAIQIFGKRVYGAEHVRALTGVAPMAAIPYLHTPPELARQERFKRYVIGGGVLLLLIVAAILSFPTLSFG